MGQHAILAPSSAERWVPCPGSVSMEMMVPDTESDESDEGTQAHELAAAMVRADSTLSPRPATDDHPDEMAEAAAIFADDVQAVMRQTGVFGGDNLLIEQKLAPVDVLHPNTWGTPDAVVFDQNHGHLYVWDFKYGHREVQPWGNWQLICYAALALGHFGVDGRSDQAVTVHLKVVQPRSYSREGPVRSWTVMASDLRGYFNQLKMAGEYAMGANAECVPGPHCRDCRARAICPALHKVATHHMDVSEQPVPLQLDDSALSAEIRYLRKAQETLGYRLEALEADAVERSRDRAIPGTYVRQKYGNKQWKTDNQEVISLGDLMGVDLRRPLQPITPRQAVQAGVPEDLIDQYSERRKTGVKLEIDENQAEKVFKND